MRWRTVFSPPTTSVCPALFPPWNRTTTCACSVSKSTTLPFPSSPHCAPTTTTFGISAGLYRSGFGVTPVLIPTMDRLAPRLCEAWPLRFCGAPQQLDRPLEKALLERLQVHLGGLLDLRLRQRVPQEDNPGAQGHAFLHQSTSGQGVACQLKRIGRQSLRVPQARLVVHQRSESRFILEKKVDLSLEENLGTAASAKLQKKRQLAVNSLWVGRGQPRGKGGAQEPLHPSQNLRGFFGFGIGSPTPDQALEVGPQIGLSPCKQGEIRGLEQVVGEDALGLRIRRSALSGGGQSRPEGKFR